MSRESALQRKRVADGFSDEFRQKTGISLGRFFNVILGFDVVKWDAWLEVPEGQSASQVTTERFGEPFTATIQQLI
jgi:hypothetical protein